jgi:predicted alpha/beta hydrolase
MSIHTESIDIPATDGFSLGATLYSPETENADTPVVLISPAMAVKQTLYRGFARFLAERGFRVVTYDPRGIGRSCPRSLRGFPATMRDWGTKDLTGVIDWLTERFPRSPLLALGHSSGGQLLG